MHRFSTLAAALVIMGAAFIMLPTKAHATGTRYFHASLCRGLTSTGGASPNVILNGFGQLEVTASSGNTIVWCPLILDPTVSEIPSNATVLMSFYQNGGGGSSPFAAHVCRAPAGGGNPVCTSDTSLGPTTPSVVPNLSLNLPSVNVGDYLYIVATVGPHINSGGDNTLFGYRLVNP
jgi:hypothetical protein